MRGFGSAYLGMSISSSARLQAVLQAFDQQQGAAALTPQQEGELLRHVASYYEGYTISEAQYNEKRNQIYDLLNRHLPSTYSLKLDLAPQDPTWANAVRAAGLIPTRVSCRLTTEREATRSALLNEIVRLLSDTGKLSYSSYNASRRTGSPHAGLAKPLFGSWAQAVEAARTLVNSLH